MISKIESAIKKVVGEDVKFSITASEKPEFGHYSTNAAFFVKEDPNELAAKIQKSGGNLFEKTEVKGKFINLWISKEALVKELVEVLDPPSLKLRKGRQKICLEFISANPTGPLTMANGRGGFLGDALGNVLEAVGHKVTREYYINDGGNQVRLLGESILAALGKMAPQENHYQGKYIKEIANKIKNKIDYRANVKEIGRAAARELLPEIKKAVISARIKFDVWYSEYEKLHKGKLIQKILGLLEKGGLVEDKEGARWLKTSEIEDEKDRVLVKSDGEPTYFLVDLAYHYDKFFKRKFDKAIDIWGADHHGYVARLKSGVKALGINQERLKIIITQLVRLVEGGKEVRMSKRKGEFVTLDELVSEVGKDAARFFFLMHSPDTHMDFDLALAKEKSVKNPVYYVQYAYVRCLSILRKVKSKKEKLKNLEALSSESEFNLVRELVKLPDVVLQTAEDYQVSRLARYAMELAKAVHNFYEKERVIAPDGKISEPRLALVAATKNVLERLFKILGIEALEKM